MKIRLRTLGFYYLCLRGSAEEKMRYGAKYSSEITMQSLAFMLASLALFLLTAFIGAGTSVTMILFMIASVNLPIALFLTGIQRIRYQDFRWNELEKQREEVRKKNEQLEREIEQLKRRCYAKIEELRDISFAYGCYSEFSENIMSMTRQVRNALSKATLEALLTQIENNIRFIRDIYGKKREEERRQREQQYKEQQQRQYSQWASSSNSLANYLRVLGLSSNERDMNVIKKRRKELAIKYHPDNKETGNLQKMQEINNAFDEIEKILR